jgi:hypothetical protein
VSDFEDPEVEADIRLRESTRYDTSRNLTGKAPTWTPPKVLDRVPCRARCGAVVAWTDDAEEKLQIFNGILKRKMEPEIDRTKTLFCNSCRVKGAEMSAERNRKQVDFVAERIKELKNGAGGDRYRELLDQLRKAGHPDVDGLHQCLLEKAAQKPSKRITRGSL